ncbi:putative protein-lysine deacylase ABHD14B [Liolophura sinensis]|uniref:putative protein-lysine deacylase ABHD14B n=1 Tax=Liolophura sinensis TaxID=3198878 RepID=UPI0031586029
MPTTKSKQDVLLLHGASFSAQNWKEIKTLETFGALGYRMVAINRPDELKASVKKTIALEFLVNLIQALKLDKPIVVSPSASGELAIPLLGMGEEHIRGFVSLAPVTTDLFTPEHYKNVKVPILIVYGEKDTGLGHQSLENLKNIPNHKTYVMKDGGHAAYISKPDVFHQCLYSFLEDITAKNT